MSDISLKEWILAARPKTLTAAFVPVICGYLIVNYYSTQHISIALTALALVCAVLIQVGTNFFNDVVDFKSGVDSDQRSGPRRLLQQGKVSETKMRAAAHSCFILALIFGFPLILKGGFLILVIGIVPILIGYSYSAAPLKLAYRGLAEPFVVLFFGVIAVVGIEWLHTRSFSKFGALTGLQLGFLATVLMVINNVRDYREDAAKGKLTLVARYGRTFGIVEIILLYTLVFTISCFSPAAFLPLEFLGYFWIVPAALVIQSILFRIDTRDLNRTLALAALAHLVFGLTLAIRLLW